VIALGTAPSYEAQIGVLNQTKCTIHWQKLAAFAETFNKLRVTDSIFAKHRGVWLHLFYHDLHTALIQAGARRRPTSIEPSTSG
jgi:hypothetical protein